MNVIAMKKEDVSMTKTRIEIGNKYRKLFVAFYSSKT